jgi:hypothetical protein
MVGDSPNQRRRAVAQKVEVKFIDDLDGSEAVGTVQFGIDGKWREVDLNKEHEQALRESLEDFLAVSRPVADTDHGRRAGRKVSGGSARTVTDREQTQAIREWARANGHQVSDRGRIPKAVVEAYQAAH